MAFEFLGAAGGGAASAYQDLVLQRIREQQLQQQMAEFQQQMELQRSTLAQRGREHADELGLRERQLAADEETRREAREVAGSRRRQEQNQTGVRRMIGDFLVQRGTQPSASERATLQGMALQEDVALPRAVTDPSPEELSAADEAKRTRDFSDFTRRADYQESQLRSRPARPAREALTPGQAFAATRQLRNDFVRETAATREVQRQFQQMRSAMEAARAGDLAAGSQGVLVTFQKILDPTSVVRESEYARSAAGQSLLSRIEGAAVRLAQGGAGVPVRELERFVALAEQFAKNQATAALEAKQQIDAIAEEYGLDPSRITRDYGPTEGAAGTPEQRPIPGVPGGIAELRDGRWIRIK